MSSGIQCPKCGKELVESHESETQLSRSYLLKQGSLVRVVGFATVFGPATEEMAPEDAPQQSA